MEEEETFSVEMTPSSSSLLLFFSLYPDERKYSCQNGIVREARRASPVAEGK